MHSLKIRELTEAQLADRAALCPRVYVELDGMAAAMEQLQKGEGYSFWAREQLIARKDEFLPQVLAMFETAIAKSSEDRISLAYLLHAMGLQRGRDYLVAQLQSPDPLSRFGAVSCLEYRKSPPESEAESEMLLSLLRDGDARVRTQAIGACCALLKIERFRSALEKLLQTEGFSDSDRRMIEQCLGNWEPVETRIETLRSFLGQRSHPDDISWGLGALRMIIYDGTPAQAAAALAAAEDFFLNSPSASKCKHWELHSFSGIVTARALPAFKSMVENATESGIRNTALTTVARLDPALALQFLNSHADSWSINAEFLRAFQNLASEAQWTALVKLLLESHNTKRPLFRMNNATVDILLEHGQAAGRSFVLEELPKMEPFVRMYAAWKLNGWTIHDALADLKARGLVSELPDRALIDKVRKDTMLREDAELFLFVLEEAVVIHHVSHDVEHEYRPPDHRNLLVDYTEATDGVFAPTFCRQIPLGKPDAKPDAKESPDHSSSAEVSESEADDYLFSFVLGNRLFEFDTFRSHRRYDINAVEPAVIAALEQVPGKRRLVRVDTDRDGRSYFFGEPENIRQFCSAFYIPLIRG